MERILCKHRWEWSKVQVNDSSHLILDQRRCKRCRERTFYFPIGTKCPLCHTVMNWRTLDKSIALFLKDLPEDLNFVCRSCGAQKLEEVVAKHLKDMKKEFEGKDDQTKT